MPEHPPHEHGSDEPDVAECPHCGHGVSEAELGTGSCDMCGTQLLEDIGRPPGGRE